MMKELVELTILDEGDPQSFRVRAYEQAMAAIEAFEQSFQVEAKPGLLYSIGQAHRRQYAIDRRPGHVAVAIRHFREYITAPKTRQSTHYDDASCASGHLRESR